MTPAHATKKSGRRYRYYSCLNTQKRGWDACPTKSVPASEIERFVVDQIRGIGNDPALIRETVKQVSERQEHPVIYESDVEKALAAFDPLWQTLTNREQARAMEVLLKEVAYDGRSGKVVITFHANGIQALSHQSEATA